MSRQERTTIHLEHIAYWPMVALSSLLGLLAGLAVAVPFLIMGVTESLGADGWIELNSGILSYRMTGEVSALLVYLWPLISMLVHAAVAVLLVAFYNSCARLIAPISFTIGSTPASGPGETSRRD